MDASPEQLGPMLHRVLKDAKTKPRRKVFARRSSSLPFCARRFVFERRIPKKMNPHVSRTLDSDLILDTGTAAHETIQRYLGLEKMLYGNWRCHRLDYTTGQMCWHLEENQVGPRYCPKCNMLMSYEEYQMKDPSSGFTGHPDGLLVFPGMEGYHMVPPRTLLEIKTIADSILSRLSMPKFPHLIQASFYSFVLPLCFGDIIPKIERILFVYVSRGYPSKRKIFTIKPMEGALTILRTSLAEAQLQLAQGVLPVGICNNTKEAEKMFYCPWAGMCFSPMVESFLRPMEEVVKEETEDSLILFD